ncbi:MAG: nucleotidyltransferase domain-containing protein [Candidatus Zixiibacteriota bacterium]|jgi:predicted nucleotidyltransferase
MVTKRKTKAPRFLKELVARVVQAAAPSRVIMFGSRARGDAGPRSDVDLLVVVNNLESRRALAAKIYEALADVHVAADIVVATEEDLRTKSGVRGALVNRALREGVTLYAA